MEEQKRSIRDFQKKIEEIYFTRDSKRGKEGTTLWFVEEVGELIRAIRRNEKSNLEEEFADVLAWLVTLGSIVGVDVEKAAWSKYGKGCPRCGNSPCTCK